MYVRGLGTILVPSPLFLYVHDKGQIRNIMKRNISNTILTKDYIFSKVSQITIFSTYTGISVEDIQHCIDTGEFISSPFREDTHPSFGFRYDNRNKLKGRDFAGYWWGDCIDAAATVLSEIVHKQIDISIKSQFLFVLKHIAYTFRNIIYGQDKDENNDYNIARAISNVRNHKPIIELVTRPWNNLDAKYWGQFGINLNFLNTHFVYPVDQFYINRSTNPIPKYFYDKDKTDLCYGYVLGQDKRGIVNVKLYFPNRNKKTEVKFITNSNTIEGVINLELDNYDIIIITKSTKDRLSLECYLKSINHSILYGGSTLESKTIGVVNIPHETYKLRQIEYDWLRSKLNRNGFLISLMDNDRTGLMEAIILKNDYDIIPIIIPKELGVKDFAELRSSYSTNVINELTQQVVKYIEENYGEETEFTWDTEESNTLPY